MEKETKKASIRRDQEEDKQQYERKEKQMFFKFITEYRKWKLEHREEVQQAKLRQEALKTPLNYQVLDKMFQIWTSKHKDDAVMEIQGKDFNIKFYWDNGEYKRLTTTERIMRG